jgi:hypothetical protein
VCLILRLVFLQRGAQRDERDIYVPCFVNSAPFGYGAARGILMGAARKEAFNARLRVLNGLVGRHLTKSKAGRAPSLEGAMRSLLSSVDHKESRRLFRRSHHIPFVTILAACWIVAAVLSAALTILAEGPHNFVP